MSTENPSAPPATGTAGAPFQNLTNQVNNVQRALNLKDNAGVNKVTVHSFKPKPSQAVVTTASLTPTTTSPPIQPIQPPPTVDSINSVSLSDLQSECDAVTPPLFHAPPLELAPLDLAKTLPRPLTTSSLTATSVAAPSSSTFLNSSNNFSASITTSSFALNSYQPVNTLGSRTPGNGKKPMKENEKVQLLGMALQQSNKNLESSHGVIRVLRAQIDEMKAVVQMQIARISKKAEANSQNLTAALNMSAALNQTSPLSSNASTISTGSSGSASSTEDNKSIFGTSSMLASPDSPPRSTAVASQNLSPNSSAAQMLGQAAANAAWQFEKQSLETQNSSLSQENFQLRCELDALKQQLSGADNLMYQMKALQMQVVQQEKELKEKEQEKYDALALRRKLTDEIQKLKGNIRVVARVRPLIEKEKVAAEGLIVHTESRTNLIALDNGSLKPHSQFEFDSTLGMDSKQEHLFEEAEMLITSVLDGFNVCILAYGISGSGKTYSMEGTSEHPGLNARSLHSLFAQMGNQKHEYDFDVKLNMVEIYVEQIRDLLMQLKGSYNANHVQSDVSGAEENEDAVSSQQMNENEKCTGVCEIQTLNNSSSSGAPSVQLRGAVTLTVRSLAEVESAMRTGYTLRASASTNTNQHSSRSHCIVTLSIVSTHKKTGTRLYGKLHLVDLAGSEDVSRSEVEGQQLRESKNINKSLSSLSLVFQALSNKQAHIPYRNSRLTHLLSDSLGGNSKSLLVLCLNPTESVHSETLNCLKFGQTVRTVRLGVTQNKEVRPQKRASAINAKK